MINLADVRDMRSIEEAIARLLLRPEMRDVLLWLADISLRSINIKVEGTNLVVSAESGGQPFKASVDTQIALATLRKEANP